MTADPQLSDADLPQYFIDWYIDPLARTVGTDPAFGPFPLHLKHEDDFDWRLRFKVGGPASEQPVRQLSQLTEIKFVMLEKGRYDGTPLALGTASTTWDQDNACYHLPVSLNGPALAAYLATLDATSTGFATGGFDCTAAAAKAAGTTTTTTTDPATQTSTTTTAPGKPAPSALTDLEFMAEFRWVQNGKQMRSQTFALFVARDLITTTAQSLVIAPPALPTDWRFLCTLHGEGMPFSGKTFGYVRAPLQMEVLGLQVALGQVDPGAGFRIQLTDRAGAPLSGGTRYFGDLPANTAFAELLFGQVLPMNQGDEVRAVIQNYAGSQLAEALTVNLICRQYLTNSPAGPSGPPGITSALAKTLPPGSPASASVSGQVLNLGIPQGVPGHDGAAGKDGAPGASVTQVTVEELAPNAAPTASLVNQTLHLGIPQGVAGAPGTGVTLAQVTPLPAGTQPTAYIRGGTLFLGIPAGATGATGPAPFASAAATTLKPNEAATANIVSNVLRLGIPAGETGSYLHVSPTVDARGYDQDNDEITSFTFTGVGKPALILLSFRNEDDVTFNQTDVFWSITRDDDRGTVLSSGVTLAHQGNTYPVMDMAIDPATATHPVKYTLKVGAYSGGLPSANNPKSKRASGTVAGALIVVLEIVN